VPTGGALTVLGQDMRQVAPGALRRLRARIAFVPQAHGLVGGLSAVQNVAMGRAGRAGAAASVRTLLLPTRADRQAAFHALDRLGVGEMLDQRVDQLSGGQQQRVAVARALRQDGELIVADEPVASVDGPTADAILGVLAELIGRGRTVLVSLHQSDLAARYCDEVVRLTPRGGRA
jgi:phosphonate transport system ATP-binding protein